MYIDNDYKQAAQNPVVRQVRKQNSSDSDKLSNTKHLTISVTRTNLFWLVAIVSTFYFRHWCKRFILFFLFKTHYTKKKVESTSSLRVIGIEHHNKNTRKKNSDSLIQLQRGLAVLSHSFCEKFRQNTVRTTINALFFWRVPDNIQTMTA